MARERDIGDAGGLLASNGEIHDDTGGSMAARGHRSSVSGGIHDGEGGVHDRLCSSGGLKSGLDDGLTASFIHLWRWAQ